MKRMATIFFGLMLVASFAQAASFTAQTEGTTVYGEISSRAAVSITQNLDPNILEQGSVACGVTGSHTTANWFGRRFILAEHGLVEMNVEDVDFGIEQVDIFGADPNQPFDLVLYTIDTGAGMFLANFNEIARVGDVVTAADAGTFRNLAIAGNVPAGSDLIVAIDAPDGEPNFAQFRPGVNAQGATTDSWLYAADCGLTEPVQVGDINFPDSQLVLVVNGNDGTTATEATDFSSVKSLY